MENFNKYSFNHKGELINTKTGKVMSKITGKESYCLYDNEGYRRTVSANLVRIWRANQVEPSLENGGLGEVTNEPPEKEKPALRSSLTPAQIIEIYKQRNNGVKAKEVALAYGVSLSTIFRILSVKIHKEIINGNN